jgi:hypothetical protein
VRYAISREGIDFTLHREVLRSPSFGIIDGKIGAETLQPGESLLLICFGSFGRDCPFDNCITMLLEMI